jgi:23S rRNA pseudouridine2604 synthase
VVRKLGEDSDRIEQEYVAEVTGAIVEDGLARLNRGGRPNAPIKASWQSEARLRFAGKGIVPGQIEALCAQVGLQVTSLRRLRIGRVALSGLPVGLWRYLRDVERF